MVCGVVALVMLVGEVVCSRWGVTMPVGYVSVQVVMTPSVSQRVVQATAVAGLGV